MSSDDAQSRIRAFLANNGLLLSALGLFATFFVAMIAAGTAAYNQEQLDHGSAQVSVREYVMTGDMIEATFENWESEFLQMGMYVVMTALLFQKGSSESKSLRHRAPQDADPHREAGNAKAPWPVRRGGIVLTLYENSLSLALFALFLASVALHAIGGSRAYSEEQVQHGLPPVNAWDYLGTSQFWFESMQNWQSEFIAVAAIVALPIFLRQRGSEESKPVAAPDDQTGA